MSPIAQGSPTGAGIPAGFPTVRPSDIPAGASPPPFVASLLASASEAAAKSAAAVTATATSALTAASQHASQTASDAARPSTVPATRPIPFSISIPNPAPPDDNKGPGLLAFTWTFRSLVLIVVALRIWTKLRPRKTFGWDDAAIVVAGILTLVGGPIDIMQVKTGTGRHFFYLDLAKFATARKWQVFSQMFNFLSLFFMRTSVCIFTMRVAPRTKKWPRWAIWVAFVINLLATLGNLVAFGAQCRPFNSIWNLSIPQRCYSLTVLRRTFLATSIAGSIDDFTTVGVPILLVATVKLPTRKKAGVIALLSLGFLTALCSILKMIYSVVIPINDPSWDGVRVEMWSTLEECLGIVVASMPALRTLIVRNMNKRKESRRSGTSAESSSGKLQRLLESFRKKRASEPSMGPSYSEKQGVTQETQSSDGKSGKKDGVIITLHEKDDIESSVASPASPASTSRRTEYRSPEDVMITLHGTHHTFHDEEDHQQDDRWVERRPEREA